MLERIPVNPITHPYPSSILLTPASRIRQLGAETQPATPGCGPDNHRALAAEDDTALWKQATEGRRSLKEQWGSILLSSWPTPASRGGCSAVRAGVGKTMAPPASGHNAAPLCPGLGLPARHPHTREAHR